MLDFVNPARAGGRRFGWSGQTRLVVRIHKTLRTTPAMAAGVTGKLWGMSDMVDVLEAWEKSYGTRLDNLG